MPPHCMRARHYFSRENTICRLLTFRASEISFNGPKCFFPMKSHEIPFNSSVSCYLAIYSHTFWTPDGTSTKGFDPGFSIAFFTAVAVVVRGVTQRLCILCRKRTSARDLGSNMGAIFQRCGDVAKRLLGHSVVFWYPIHFDKTEERYIAKETNRQ